MKSSLRIALVVLCIAVAVMPLYSEYIGKTVDNYVKELGINPDKSIEENVRFKNMLLEKSGVSELALTVFGSLGKDGCKSVLGGKKCDVVGSTIEYYYADLVFIKKDYAAALKTLFSQRMEEPGRNTECCNAVIFIIEYAHKQGVEIKSLEIEAAWEKEKTAEIMYYARKSNCSEEGINLVMDYYFKGMSYSKFISKLKSLQEKDFTSVMAILETVSGLNPVFGEKLSGELGQ